MLSSSHSTPLSSLEYLPASKSIVRSELISLPSGCELDAWFLWLGGFADAQAAGAKSILAAVKKVFSDHGISKVTLVGHSLGAAISTIEGVYLKLALPSTTTFKHVLHGSPRVGNQEFANYIDSHVCRHHKSVLSKNAELTDYLLVHRFHSDHQRRRSYSNRSWALPWICACFGRGPYSGRRDVVRLRG